MLLLKVIKIGIEQALSSLIVTVNVAIPTLRAFLSVIYQKILVNLTFITYFAHKITSRVLTNQ